MAIIDIWDGRVVETKIRPGEIARMNRDSQAIVRAANDANLTLSRFLEHIDPSEDYESARDGTRLDAFGRQFKELGIITVTDPVRGVYADTLDDFRAKGGMPLLYEFCNRRRNEARWGRPANPFAGGIERQIAGRSVFTSADEGLGTIWRPIFESARERSTRIEAPIPLSLIVSTETGINNNVYKGGQLIEPDPNALHRYRIGELAEIPLTTITLAEYEVGIYKYGIGFGLSYEAARRQPMDKISFFLQKVALQDEVDKVEHAISVALSGDGNNNAATSYNLSDLDASATPGMLSVAGWLAFKAKFANAYSMDLAFAREADWLDIQTLQFPNNNTMFYQTAGQFGAVRNINRAIDQAVGLGILASTPLDKIIGMDSRFALGHVFETGSQIKESQRFITSQMEVVVMSENEGFEVNDPLATRVLDLNA